MAVVFFIAAIAGAGFGLYKFFRRAQPARPAELLEDHALHDPARR